MIAAQNSSAGGIGEAKVVTDGQTDRTIKRRNYGEL